MFIDEINLLAVGGDGGDGCASFAHRKYQPFAGPDGGDGGTGGSVVLRSTRNRDSLDHLRTFKAVARNGSPGGANLRIGADGPNLSVEVPPGTMAFRALQLDRVGEVRGGGEEFVLAKGGRGGRGNPHFATGGRRSPKDAEAGRRGVEQEYLLRYRIYTDNALLEDPYSPVALLPRLLNKPPADIQYDLYSRKPRWIRVAHEYREYDVAYIPVWFEGGFDPEAPLLPHVYWARHLLVNLDPQGEHVAQAAQDLLRQLAALPLRRLEQITLAGVGELDAAPLINSEDRDTSVDLALADNDALSIFRGQLTGGIVS